MSRRAVIIGAGVGGLAIANLLAKTGWRVDVYEQAAGPGGRAGQLKLKGFTFDMGPSLYLMPEVFEHYFSLLGTSVAQQLDVRQLTPSYKVWFDHRDPVGIHSSLARDTQTFESLEPGAGQALQSYATSANRLYSLVMEHFFYNTYGFWRSASQPGVWKAAPRLPSLIFDSLHRHVGRTMHSLPTQQILEYPSVFLGASPWNAPAIYSMMSHLDFNSGVYYPMGGMYEVVRSLERLGKDLGVTYHYDSPVSEIAVERRRATGVRVPGGTIGADLVISNADLHFTETRLLPEPARTYPEAFWRRKVAGPSALMIYLGVKGKLPQLAHHNLLFIEQWADNFAEIFDHPAWPERASLYVSRTSATDPTVAPAGHENLVILVPLPPDLKRPADPAAAAERYIKQFADMIGLPGLSSRIVLKRTFGPFDYADTYNSWQSSALGLAHTLNQSAFWRPGNRSRRVNNLWYVGHAVRPGIGVPSCLVSAELTFKGIVKDGSPGPLPKLTRMEEQHG